MALNCSGIQTRLQEYACRELDPQARHEVDEHLLTCAECRKELALLNAIVSALDLQPRLEPPPGFSTRVLAQLPARARMPVSPWWALALAPVLALAAFLFRAPLLRELTALPGRFGIGPRELSSLPAGAVPGVQPVFLLGLILAGLTLGACVFGLVLGWKYYANEI